LDKEFTDPKIIDDSRKIIVSQHSGFKASDSFSSISKSYNGKEAKKKKKVLTFDSVFNKNNKSNINPLLKPQNLISNVIGTNNLGATNAPINININNYNIHILKNDNKDPLFSGKKKMTNNVLNNILNNPILPLVTDSNNVFSHNTSGQSETAKRKYFLINNSNTKLIINKNINNGFVQTNDSIRKIKENKQRDFLDKIAVKKILDEDDNINLENMDNFYTKNKQQGGINIKSIIDDQNDSLIDDLADFLNNENPKKRNEEKKIDEIEIQEENNQLDDALLENNISDNQEQDNKILKSTRNVQQNDFISINERQIVSSSTNNFNNLMSCEEEGPPINYEHYQQVNSKRPQTSYGGISARQKSLQKNLKQKSMKEDGNVDGPDMNQFNQNPFAMKNKLCQIKYFFNS